MDKELENIINSNVDLSKYYDKYHHNITFLKHYYLQDPNRIVKEKIGIFPVGLTVDDMLELLDELFKRDINIDAINEVCSSLYYDYYSNNIVKDKVDKVIIYLEQLGKEGKINPVDFDIYAKVTSNKDPVSAVLKNPSNILFLEQVNSEELAEILKICAESGYLLTRDLDLFLIRSGIYDNKEAFKYLLYNCQCEEKLINNLYYDTVFSKEEMYELYYKYKNEHNIIIDTIINHLNHNSLSLDTILKDEDVFYDCDNVDNKISKEEMLEFFKKLADKNNKFDKLVILIMSRVDMDFVNKAHDILGDKLRISPLANQEVEDLNRYNVPTYTYESIKKSEEKLDLYARTTADCLDKDGDIKHLSPFEKYLAAFKLVTSFAQYAMEEDPNEWNISRSVYDITNQDGEIKIVCAGYVNLLIELLERMGIKSAIYWPVRIQNDSLYYDHARLIIYLKDEKYGIDGIYMSDPTWDSKWDNNLPKNTYNYFLLSRPEIKKIDEARGISSEGLYIDNHSIIDAFNVYNVDELFSKPIEPDAFVKAYLSLNYFLDKNKKMVKSDDDYSALDFYATACELNMERKLAYLNKFDYDKMAEEALVMPISLMKEYYTPKEVVFMLLNVYAERIESKISNFMLDAYFSFGYDMEKEEYYIYSSPDLDNAYERNKLSKVYQCDMNGNNPQFRIYNFDGRPVKDQIDDIIKACEKFDKTFNELRMGAIAI